jgi:alginate O-acetyltransferase complex protein AlgI
MLFNSLPFAIFFPILLSAYWLFLNKNIKAQNLLLLAGSYFFYGWWDWRFLFLLVSLSTCTYYIAVLMKSSASHGKKKLYYFTGLFVSLVVLALFKYAGFFADSLVLLLNTLGLDIIPSSINIILPLGISFYTFLSISYITDVYRGNFQAEDDFLCVLLSISFFPILLAGPIQRPSTLIPQIKSERIFNSAQIEKGFSLILKGLFMKIVIADGCSSLANTAFTGYSQLSGSDVLLGVVFFVVQIYADFAGYSNIATGLGSMLGFNIMQNFNYPYFSKDIKEFWKRWNISLTSWFRDYVFLPLAYWLSSKIIADRFACMKTESFIYVTVSICTWSLTGFWHGAGFTFIIWGLIQGLFLILYHLAAKPRRRLLKRFKISHNNMLILITEYVATMTIVSISFIFFKANSISAALGVLKKITSESIFTLPEIKLETSILIAFIIFFFSFEWTGRNNKYTLTYLLKYLPKNAVWVIYFALIIIIFLFGGRPQQFIYLQF